ncbi:MAG: hypothetical protein IJ433_00195 [Ruminococcus sp.]|nr:hypothetical protein [Ruminococcus sp.]
MVEYKIQTQTITLNDNQSYTSYGIVALSGEKVVTTVDDVSTDKIAVEKLVDKFNTYKLVLCHLEQAIENYLYNLEVD